MDAGIATAVPKPAMPSMKLPKPQPIIRARTRLSWETPPSIRLICSIAPVFRVRLYVNSAAIITRQMGHRAFSAPSRAAVATEGMPSFQYPAASAAEIRNAITQALCPAIFSPLSATISQRIGSIARRNFRNNIFSPPFQNWVSHFHALNAFLCLPGQKNAKAIIFSYWVTHFIK